MKKFTVARAQSIYSLAPSIFATLPVVELVEALKAKYQFGHTPTIQELLNPPANQPTNFAWGKASLPNRTVTIETLSIQNFVNLATTVSVITRTSTDDSDAVLADLAEWVSTDFDIDTKPVLPSNYLNQAEVVFDKPIGAGLAFLNGLATRMTQLVRGYGFTECPAFEPTALYVWYDNTKTTTPPTLALNFYIDRRAGAPFVENKYFTQAPLKTHDHRVIIEELEKALFNRSDS